MKNSSVRRKRRLSDLKPGDAAFIHAIDHDAPSGHRLAVIGLLPGSWLRFLRTAPFGDPLMVEICGTQICLRRREAMLIEMEEGEL